jgi:ribonuclease R
VIEEQPVFEAVITPLRPHVKTGGKPAKHAAKPKPSHLDKPRKTASKTRAAKTAGKTSRPPRKR